MDRDDILTSAQLGAWEKAAGKSAPGGDPTRLAWTTPEGLVVKPLYTAADLVGLPYTDTLPGFAPFIRGPQARRIPGLQTPLRRWLHRCPR